MKQKVPESAVLNSVIELLNYLHIPYARVNNTGTIIKRDGKTFFGRRKHSQKGVADIICCYKGNGVAIEVKGSDGSLSEDQKNWLFNWQKAGGHFIVARDAEKVSEFLRLIDQRTW